MAPPDPTRLLIRREIRSGRKPVHRLRSRLPGQALPAGSSPATASSEHTDEPPVAREAIEAHADDEAQSESHVEAVQMIGRIAKLAGLTDESSEG